ncbi:MAG: amidohydrolase [Peptococcaceae bacterium]|nr:amidohydrolase [Peptococcaceae bacterium]
MLKSEILAAIEEMVLQNQNELIQTRRVIHQNPELSFKEIQTSERIYNALQEIPSLSVSRPTETSVLAVLKGGKEGKALALRSDMDALAIQEENQIDYQSLQPGVMHACGHDGHIAMLLSAAKILARFQSEIKGEIRFIFQHAEEYHPGGAREIVRQGVLKGVDGIFAVHLWVPLSVGKIGIARGPLMAAPDNFDITILGKGGHAAMPQETIDPILVSAQVITGLQALVSRMNNPLDPLVLSITGIHGGGTAYNVIPSQVDMKGTVRTFSREKRREIPAVMEKMIAGVCSAYGAGYTFQYELGYDPVINDDSFVSKISDILLRTVGADALETVSPVMGGEDFSAYLQDVPGALLFIGAGNAEKGIVNPHHHPRFNIDEESLVIGLRVLILTSMGFLDMI